jgi:hypothetical protein
MSVARQLIRVNGKQKLPDLGQVPFPERDDDNVIVSILNTRISDFGRAHQIINLESKSSGFGTRDA